MANNDWQEFQFIQGAVFNNETIVSFGNIQNELLCAAQADIVCDLSHLATLALSGDDALTFLQGQVTNGGVVASRFIRPKGGISHRHIRLTCLVRIHGRFTHGGIAAHGAVGKGVRADGGVVFARFVRPQGMTAKGGVASGFVGIQGMVAQRGVVVFPVDDS